MTKEVAMALGGLANQMNELGRRIDNLYGQLHQTNVDNIDANADALCEYSVDIEERIVDLENALCELSEE